MLSTLFPVTDMVRSQEDTSGTSAPLNYSVFYNVEASVWYSLNYNWVFSGTFGWYNYETRKENALTRNDPTQTGTPVFHQFELAAFPIMLGVRYRFLTDDIVPYVGIGAGMAFTKRKSFYDNDPAQRYVKEVSQNAIVAQATAGLEFYFASNGGLRIEASGYYMKLQNAEHNTGGSPGLQPIILYQANPWSVRYSSGVFFMF